MCSAFPLNTSLILHLWYLIGGPRLDKPLEEFQLKQQQEMFGALAQQQATDAAVFASATPQERTVAAQMAAIAQIAAQQQQQQQHQQHQHQHQMQQQFSQQQVGRDCDSHHLRSHSMYCTCILFSISWALHRVRGCTKLRCRHDRDLKAGLKGNTRYVLLHSVYFFSSQAQYIKVTSLTPQDGGSSYHRPTKNNSDHLVIDSWTDEDNEKAQATQQHMGKYQNPSSILA